jgi:hypothetical protein
MILLRPVFQGLESSVPEYTSLDDMSWATHAPTDHKQSSVSWPLNTRSRTPSPSAPTRVTQAHIGSCNELQYLGLLTQSSHNLTQWSAECHPSTPDHRRTTQHRGHAKIESSTVPMDNLLGGSQSWGACSNTCFQYVLSLISSNSTLLRSLTLRLSDKTTFALSWWEYTTCGFSKKNTTCVYPNALDLTPIKLLILTPLNRGDSPLT